MLFSIGCINLRFSRHCTSCTEGTYPTKDGGCVCTDPCKVNKISLYNYIYIYIYNTIYEI